MSKIKRETLTELIDCLQEYNDVVIGLLKYLQKEKIGTDNPYFLLKQLEVTVRGFNVNEAVSNVLEELSE